MSREKLRQSSPGWQPSEWLQDIADPVKLAVMQMLSEEEPASVNELARWCQASTSTLRRHLQAMVASGLLEEHAGESDGCTTGRPATCFSLSPGVEASVRATLRPTRPMPQSSP